MSYPRRPHPDLDWKPIAIVAAAFMALLMFGLARAFGFTAWLVQRYG